MCHLIVSRFLGLIATWLSCAWTENLTFIETGLFDETPESSIQPSSYITPHRGQLLSNYKVELFQVMADLLKSALNPPMLHLSVNCYATWTI